MKQINRLRIFKNLKPIIYQQFIQLDPIERAKHFTLPEINDLQIIRTAHQIMAYYNWQANIANCRYEFRLRTGGNQKTAESFEQAYHFYSSLICGADDLLFALDPDIINRFPNFKIDKSYCLECNSVIFSKQNFNALRLIPPNHWGCKAWWEDSEEKCTRNKLNSTGSIKYICNPFDLLIANGLLKKRDLKNNKNNRKSKNGCLVIFIIIAAIALACLLAFS